MYKYVKASQGLMGSGSVFSLEQRPDDMRSQIDHIARNHRLNSRIVDYVKTENLDPDRYVYTVVVPLGGCESWAETVNGDAFERKWLAPRHPLWGHSTFETKGGAYLHHRSSDPTISFGDLPVMDYNHEADRCEGIWRLDKQKAENNGAGYLIKKLLSGKLPEISMGAHVPYDVCSVCGNQAKTRAEWCQHVWKPGFGSIDPGSGVRMWVTNPEPSFFDLSGVLLPAAPEALVMGVLAPALIEALKNVKVAHRIVVPSAYLGAAVYGGDGLTKTSSMETVKVADMVKHIPVLNALVLNPLREEDETIGIDAPRMAKQAGSTFPQWLSSLAGMGIVLRPHEFLSHKLEFDGRDPALACDATISGPEIAVQYVNRQNMPNVLGMEPHSMRASICQMAEKFLETNSMLMPCLLPRVLKKLERQEPTTMKIRIEVAGPMASMYADYVRELASKLPQYVEHAMSNAPNSMDTVQSMFSNCKSSSNQSEQMTALQAVLPSAYILGMAGQLHNSPEVVRCIGAMSSKQSSAVINGVVL